MIHSLLQSTTIPALQETINFSQSRHNLLVSNLANQGVPGYQVRDLSVDAFQLKLREALESLEAGPATEASSPSSEQAVSETQDPMRQVRESTQNIVFRDDSDYTLEQQVNEVTKNQTLHNIAISILTQQFRLLQSAIAERV